MAYARASAPFHANNGPNTRLHQSYQVPDQTSQAQVTIAFPFSQAHMASLGSTRHGHNVAYPF